MWAIFGILCCGIFLYNWMSYPRDKPFKIGDRVLFNSWEHGWIVGHVSQLGLGNHIRIVYRSPIDGKPDAENAFSNCPRVRHLPS